MRSALDRWIARWSVLGDRLLNTGAQDGGAFRRHLQAWLFLAAVALGAMSAMDQLTAVPESPIVRARSSVSATRPGRMFVLLLDSLRWQTAMDPAIMPSLAALRARGAYARFIPTRDGVTVPALRAAFSGRERTSVFGFVRNLSHSDTGIESLFSQARAMGIRSAAYSDGSFLQFGAKTIELLSNVWGEGVDLAKQEASFRAALADFRSGRHDVVVAHVTYGDHRSHELADVRSLLYVAAFRRLDDLVREAAEAVHVDETLLVMGDHGHDELGHHGIGLDIPTAAVYRGPAYRSGVDIGTLPNVAHRYLAGAGLRLPLPGDYRGARPFQALEPPLPPDYAAAPAGVNVERGVPRARRGQALALAAYVGVLGLLWAAMLLVPVGALGALASWAAVAPMAVPALLPWSAIAGALIAMGCLVALRPWTMRPLACVALAALAAAAALAFVSWGALVLAHLPMRHPRVRHASIGIALLGTGWAIARRWGPGVAGWIVLGTTLFLLFPTLYVLGAPTVMGPVWLMWLTVQLIPPRDRRFAPTRGQVLIAATAGLLVSQFCLPDVSNFTFERWKLSADLLVPHWWSILAMVALGVILLDPGRSLRRRPMKPRSIWLGVGAALFIAALHSGRVALGRAEIAIAAALAMTAVLLRAPAWRDLRRLAGVTAGLVAMHALIRVPTDSYLWADIFLALVVLSADLASITHPNRGASRQSFLLIMGVMAVGWSMFTWSMSRLEWNFLYDWLDADTVERRVAFLLPLILARFAIPVWLIRFVLAERFGERSPPLRLAWLFLGAKVLTVVLVACGMGWVSVETDVYLSAAQQGAVWLVVLGGLV